MSITKQQLSSIAPTLKEPKLSSYVDSINKTLELYGINTPSQIAMFLAQILHESAACYYTKELASGTAYEGREDLGNTEVGDGIKFKGRGLIQITGRFNYKQMSDCFDVDFIANPALLETPEWATKSAGWFWDSRKLNSIAITDSEDALLKVSIKVNGRNKKTGLPNGWEDRKSYWKKSRKALGLV
jgi:putative chitinase